MYFHDIGPKQLPRCRRRSYQLDRITHSRIRNVAIKRRCPDVAVPHLRAQPAAIEGDGEEFAELRGWVGG